MVVTESSYLLCSGVTKMRMEYTKSSKRSYDVKSSLIAAASLIFDCVFMHKLGGFNDCSD